MIIVIVVVVCIVVIIHIARPLNQYRDWFPSPWQPAPGDTSRDRALCFTYRGSALCLCLSVWLCRSLFLPLRLCLSDPLRLPVLLSAYLFVLLSVWLSVAYICIAFYISICLPACLSVSLPACLWVCLYVYLSIYETCCLQFQSHDTRDSLKISNVVPRRYKNSCPSNGLCIPEKTRNFVSGSCKVI